MVAKSKKEKLNYSNKKNRTFGGGEKWKKAKKMFKPTLAGVSAKLGATKRFLGTPTRWIGTAAKKITGQNATSKERKSSAKWER